MIATIIKENKPLACSNSYLFEPVWGYAASLTAVDICLERWRAVTNSWYLRAKSSFLPTLRKKKRHESWVIANEREFNFYKHSTKQIW